ncbi:hypothetical protein EKH55_4607 [Sinorhizobium alkalisoli]|nr:hypothetical protein EKH55_4607 [Sinorhizobium alkalisoli]
MQRSVRWPAGSDGQPKAPARFTKKLAAWERRNGVGRIVRKEPRRERPTYSSSPCFSLHEGNFGEGGVLVPVMRTCGIESDLSFRVLERLRPGQVCVVQVVGDNVELLHLADNRDAAERWLARPAIAALVLKRSRPTRSARMPSKDEPRDAQRHA